MTHQTFDKPAPGSGRLERRKRKLARKQGVEAETFEQKLARIEFWRRMRVAVLERDGGRCRACGMTLDINAPHAMENSLHTHHLIHKSAGGLDVIDNLAALCKNCHDSHHDERLIINGTVAALSFFLKTRKGVIVSAWESVLIEALASSVKQDSVSASTEKT